MAQPIQTTHDSIVPVSYCDVCGKLFVDKTSFVDEAVCPACSTQPDTADKE